MTETLIGLAVWFALFLLPALALAYIGFEALVVYFGTYYWTPQHWAPYLFTLVGSAYMATWAFGGVLPPRELLEFIHPSLPFWITVAVMPIEAIGMISGEDGAHQLGMIAILSVYIACFQVICALQFCDDARKMGLPVRTLSSRWPWAARWVKSSSRTTRS